MRFLVVLIMAGLVQGQITRSLLDGVTPPAIESGAAAGSYKLSGFESVNLFSGGLSFSLPLTGVSGRGEAGYGVRKTFETKWSTSRSQIGQGPDYFVYVNYGGSSHDTSGYGPGHLQVRTEIRDDACGANQSYQQQTLTRLHWSGADGAEVDLVDKGTNGTAQGTGQSCQGGQITGTVNYFNRGREFVSRDGSGVTFWSDAPGGIRDNDGEMGSGAAQFTGTQSYASTTLPSSVGSPAVSLSAMSTWRLELSLKNLDLTPQGTVWWSGGLSVLVTPIDNDTYRLSLFSYSLPGQLYWDLPKSENSVLLRFQRDATGVYSGALWKWSDLTAPIAPISYPSNWQSPPITGNWNFSGALHIGANNYNQSNYKGGVDFVRFYQTNSSSNQAPSEIRPGGELYAYEFAANLEDSSGNGLHLGQSNNVSVTSALAATTGTLFFPNGMRIHTYDGRPDWIADRNGNKVTLVSENDVYRRVTKAIDSIGRETRFLYSSSLDTIQFRGKLEAGTDVTREIKIRYDELANLLRDSETVQQLKQLFPIYSYSGDLSNVNSEIFNPRMVKEIELPNGQKYQFRYNKFGEMARVTLPTGGRFEYDWLGYSGYGNGESGDLMIYRRVRERRVYSEAGLELGLTRYDAPLLTQSGSEYVVTEQEMTPGGSSTLRSAVHRFHGHPISSSLINQFGYPIWNDGRERLTESKDAAGAVMRSSEQHWRQRNPTTHFSELPTPITGRANDPRVIQVDSTLGSLTAKQTMEYSLDEFNNVTQRCDFDFGNASATRCTHYTYENAASYTALPVHLRNLVKMERVEGTGGEEARIVYTLRIFLTLITVFLDRDQCFCFC